MTAPDTPPPAPYRAPDLAAECASLRAEVARLRAIIDGRDVAPTDAEIAKHARRRCSGWRAMTGSDSRDLMTADYAREVRDVEWLGLRVRWWALDGAGHPCAWPVALPSPAEATAAAAGRGR